ncbi:MAG: hypothetical protein IKP43_02325 [Bacteroidaceae bacterium]|nr:hypothetical protein [Bacteroidaceae bacterium]
MKKTVFIISMLALMSCGGNTTSTKPENGTATEDTTTASVAPEPETVTEAVSQDEIDAKKAFVEKFYADWDDLLDYDYVKKFITPKMLQQLKDEYDYDCDGECLATWIFFYEAGGDTGGEISRSVEAQDGNHFLVVNKYDNEDYSVVLTVIKEGDEYKIDEIDRP